MQATRALLQHRQPMIRFLGKRTIPQKLDHSPKVHPESPASSLPESFASYRQKATQHGPLKPQESQAQSSPSKAPAAQQEHPYGLIGGRSARQLGPIRLEKGEVWDRSDLPQRFHRTPFTQAEIDAIESGGASQFA